MRIIEISINANLFPVKYLKKIGSSPFSILRYVNPLDPAPHLHMLCQYTIYIVSIQYKGFAGPRGGGDILLC